jgi:hypothetical protein
MKYLFSIVVELYHIISFSIATMKYLKNSRLGATWQIRTIFCFESTKEKSQTTQEKLYSEERKRERTLRTMKEVAGQQKSTEKLKQQRKAANNSKSHPGLPGGEEEAKDTFTKPDGPDDRLAILATSSHLPQYLNLVWGFGEKVLGQCGRLVLMKKELPLLPSSQNSMPRHYLES